MGSSLGAYELNHESECASGHWCKGILVNYVLIHGIVHSCKY